ncbi:hypothetical protein [Clostridium perfringens]|uniref:hypothetical protein n=1 Tax=Clostridium perfringens TaxID=1502 RepID=UPI001C86D4E9|nr:hypothetical protein [Clostridium perfringens]
MLKDYNVKIEDMNILGELKTIDEAIEKIKKDLTNKNTPEVKELGVKLLEDNLKKLNVCKEIYGGSTGYGFCFGDNDEKFVGHIFVRDNKIIGYMTEGEGEI